MPSEMMTIGGWNIVAFRIQAILAQETGAFVKRKGRNRGKRRLNTTINLRQKNK